MPYVIQDLDGNILSIHNTTSQLQTVWREEDDPLVIQFLQAYSENHATSPLRQSDLELIRVIEDLVDLLIKKQVFTFMELPPLVQQKLGNRQKMRSDMISLKTLLSDENEAGLP